MNVVASSHGSEQDSSRSSSRNETDQKKIIRNGELRFQVSDIDSTTEKIEELTRRFNGYISSSNLTSSFDQTENDVMIKVPAENFDAAVREIEKVAVFMNNRNITTKDVTAEYIDLQSRLKTKLEVKERYEDILRNKAKTVEDVLKAEEQIGSLQEEIEASEGRLRYISNQVAYSAIHLSYYQQITVKQQPLAVRHNFFLDVGNRFKDGWEIVKQLLLALISIWPLLILGLVIFILVRRRMNLKPSVQQVK
jgi:hypothetical protein